MVQTRAARRYRASLPIELRNGTNVGAFCTYAISASGCIVCGDRPNWLPNKCSVRILRPIGEAIEIPDAVVQIRGTPGLEELHLVWELAPATTRDLVEYLRNVDVEPSADAKAGFLQSENQLIHAEVLHLENHRRLGYQFLFLLIGAYFAYTVAPFKLFERSVMTVEMMAFYAIAGLWASIIILFQCNRFLGFLAASLRRRAHLYKALACNRGWLFAHDPHYFAKSIMPLGARFDDKRAWRMPYADESEKHAQWITYNAASIYFHAFLQAVFVLGCLYYLSLMLRVYDLRIVGNEQFVKGTPDDTLDLFKMNDFRWATVCFVVVPIGWLQLMTNKAAGYHKRIWEARRITETRPNPRFVDAAFAQDHPTMHRLLERGATLALAAVSVAGAAFLYAPLRNAPYEHLQAVCLAAIIVFAVMFLTVKIAHSRAVFEAAGRTDKEIKPLRSY